MRIIPRECFILGTKRAKQLCWVIARTAGATLEYCDNSSTTGKFVYQIGYSCSDSVQDLLEVYIDNDPFISGHVEWGIQHG